MLSLFFWEDWLSQALSSTTLYEWDADIVQLVLGTHFCSGFHSLYLSVLYLKKHSWGSYRSRHSNSTRLSSL